MTNKNKKFLQEFRMESKDILFIICNHIRAFRSFDITASIIVVVVLFKLH